MTEKSHIVFGPQGCGKTRNAPAIAKALGLKHIVDGGDDLDAPLSMRRFNPVETLYVVIEAPEWARGGRRVLSFEQAMAIVKARA